MLRLNWPLVVCAGGQAGVRTFAFALWTRTKAPTEPPSLTTWPPCSVDPGGEQSLPWSHSTWKEPQQ